MQSDDKALSLIALWTSLFSPMCETATLSTQLMNNKESTISERPPPSSHNPGRKTGEERGITLILIVQRQSMVFPLTGIVSLATGKMEQSTTIMGRDNTFTPGHGPLYSRPHNSDHTVRSKSHLESSSICAVGSPQRSLVFWRSLGGSRARCHALPIDFGTLERFLPWYRTAGITVRFHAKKKR